MSGAPSSFIFIVIMKGLSLLRGCLDELPKDRKATIAGDMGELKRELREKVIVVMRIQSVRMLMMIGSILAAAIKRLKKRLSFIQILILIYLN